MIINNYIYDLLEKKVIIFFFYKRKFMIYIQKLYVLNTEELLITNN